MQLGVQRLSDLCHRELLRQKVDIVVVQITFAETVSTVYFLYMWQNVRFRAACVNVDIAQKE